MPRPRPPLLLAAIALLCVSSAVSCASGPPSASVGFDYQLGGADDLAGLDVVVRDAGDPPLEGAYSICYVNGFQTQPGQGELWGGAPEAILRDAAGQVVVDPDWPDEQILDPGSEQSRAAILERIGPIIAGCADDGFDAVEIDNLDSFTRVEGIEQDDALELARSYAELAHAEGLEIAQKNAPEIAEVVHGELGYDLAIAEECGSWHECDAYADAYGERVLQIEYPDSLAAAGMDFEEVCADPDRAAMTILRDRDLVPSGQQGHLRESC